MGLFGHHHEHGHGYAASHKACPERLMRAFASPTAALPMGTKVDLLRANLVEDLLKANSVAVLQEGEQLLNMLNDDYRAPDYVPSGLPVDNSGETNKGHPTRVQGDKEEDLGDLSKETTGLLVEEASVDQDRGDQVGLEDTEVDYECSSVMVNRSNFQLVRVSYLERSRRKLTGKSISNFDSGNHGATMVQLKQSLLSLAATIPPGTPPSGSQVRPERSLEGARKLFRTLDRIASTILAGSPKLICTSTTQPAPNQQRSSREPPDSIPKPSPALRHLSPKACGPPSTLRRYPKYTDNPRRWTLEATYTYTEGHWYCKHPRCAYAHSRPSRPRSRKFGIYAAAEGCASSIMRRAREHTLKHEREDLESARRRTPELDEDGGSGEEVMEPEEMDVRDSQVADESLAGEPRPVNPKIKDAKYPPRYQFMHLLERSRGYQVSQSRLVVGPRPRSATSIMPAEAITVETSHYRIPQSTCCLQSSS
ncbi:hypothetical protein P7C70_g1982, partial [Phenoliferia sp. Uapishka_3]